MKRLSRFRPEQPWPSLFHHNFTVRVVTDFWRSRGENLSHTTTQLFVSSFAAEGGAPRTKSE